MTRAIPSSDQRVPQHTTPSANHRIQQTAGRDLSAARAHPSQIPQQLHQLDRE